MKFLNVEKKKKKKFSITRTVRKSYIVLAKEGILNTKPLRSVLNCNRSLCPFDKCQHVHQLHTRS